MRLFSLNTTTALIAVSLLFITSCTRAPQSDEAIVGEEQKVEQSGEGTAYALDLENSLIEWVGTKVTGRHNGIISISEGSVTVNENQLVGGKFTIDMNSLMGTDEKMNEEKNGKLAAHLKNEDFFDAAAFPVSIFEITGVEPWHAEAGQEEAADFEEINEYKVADPTHKVTGNFEMKGVTKSISFPAKIEMNGGMLKGVALFNLDRKQWNVNYEGAPDNVISDLIHLGIHIQSVKM